MSRTMSLESNAKRSVALREYWASSRRLERKPQIPSDDTKKKTAASVRATCQRRGSISRRLPGHDAVCACCKQTLVSSGFRTRVVGGHTYLRTKCRVCEHQTPGQQSAIRRWQKEHREVVRGISARYRAKFPEMSKIRFEAWRVQHGFEGVGVSHTSWLKILSDHKNRCVYCGRSGRLAMDHVQPLSRGGRHEPVNVVPACKSCNSSKRDRTLAEWGVFLTKRGKNVRPENQGFCVSLAPVARDRDVQTRLFAGTPEDPAVLQKSDNQTGAGNQQGRPSTAICARGRNPQRLHAEHLPMVMI